MLLVDPDRQNSSLDWADDLPKIQTFGLPDKNLRQEVKELARKYDVVIMDGGGRVTASVRAAVIAADFVLIPTIQSANHQNLFHHYTKN